MATLSIDFETASECDLIAQGIYRYATDPSTRVLMMAYSFGEGVECWLPGQAFPAEVAEHIKSGGAIAAWNAQFERLIWWYVLSPDHGAPEPRLDQFICTAARARAHGLPGSLADASRALGLPLAKDSAGADLIKRYSVPGHQKVIPQEDLDKFVEYCKRDVEVELQVASCLRELTDDEWNDYWDNEEINDRGVPINVEFARAALAYGDEIRAQADREIVQCTGGAVKNARARADREKWLATLLTPEQSKMLGGKFAQGERQQLLEFEDLHPSVRRFTELVEEAGGATISKYKAFASREVDGRLQGAFLFSGGGQTGRACIAEGEPIIVLRGAGIVEIPIETLLPSDLVWDGEAFVEHEGLHFSGYKEVIEYEGIRATPDHRVFTQAHGKIPMALAKARGDALQVSGRPSADKIQLGRPAVPDEYHEALSRAFAV